MRALPLGAALLDRQGRVRLWNDSARTRLGWSEFELVGWRLPFASEDAERAFAALWPRLGGLERPLEVALALRRRDGGASLVPVSLSAWPPGRPRPAGAVLIMLPPAGDAWAVLERMPLGVIERDAEGRIRRWSARSMEILGWPPEEALGRTLAELGLPGDRSRRDVEDWRRLLAGELNHLARDAATRTRAGAIRICRWRHFPLAAADGPPRVMSLVEDVSEQRAAHAEVQRRAHHDALTGLPNRVLFRDRLEATIGRVRREGGRGAVLALDLDSFKEINDGLGHAIGDRVLVETAGRLRARLRATDAVARFGGDEFALLLGGLESADYAGTVAEKLLEAVALPLRIEEHDLALAASIGIALIPDDGDEPETLLRHADLALYRAKAEGGGTSRFYTEELNRREQARRTLIQELRRGLEGGQLELRYQPMVRLGDRRVVGVEALLRWRHPERGLLGPGEFLDQAERSGLIQAIGAWALRTACARAAGWRVAGRDPLTLAVNLSPVQFRNGDFVDLLERVLAESGLPSSMLVVEVGEGVVLDRRSARIRAALARLAGAGIGVALDRFGTGQGCLNAIRSLPIRQIKLAPTLVGSCALDAQARAVVEAVTGFAHALGLEVVACGIETEAEEAALEALGCELGQGRLYAPPLAEADLLARLEREATKALSGQGA